MAESEDKSFAPSAQRLERAREEGNVALSREVQVFVGVAAGFCALLLMAGHVGGLCAVLRGVIEHAGDGADDPGWALGVMRQVAWTACVFVLPICGCAAVSVVGTGVLQTGFLLRLSALMPDFSKVDPLSGVARLFSSTALVELLKSVAKCALCVAVLWWQVSAFLAGTVRVEGIGAGALLGEIVHVVTRVVGALLAVQLVIAGADVAWVRFHRLSGLKMSLQDMKDEYKQTEGNPHVKGRMKALRMRAARRRMMDAVKTATVVVTNPTHYAVALVYERGAGGAPRIVAKGKDEVAARIRALARDHRVPLVANPPLARALYPLPLDAEVPMEHFRVVAGIIAYVWRLRTPQSATPVS